jgi:hypothetical protein
MNLIFAGRNRFDSGLRLSGISRIGNDDPVAMPEQRQKGAKLALPAGYR